MTVPKKHANKRRDDEVQRSFLLFRTPLLGQGRLKLANQLQRLPTLLSVFYLAQFYGYRL